MYDRKRFFTVTGDILDHVPCAVMERQPELLDLYHELIRFPSAAVKHSPLPAEVRTSSSRL